MARPVVLVMSLVPVKGEERVDWGGGKEEERKKWRGLRRWRKRVGGGCMY